MQFTKAVYAIADDELKQVPYFQKMSSTSGELKKSDVVKRHFKAGEIIYRQGEHGSTAFYILNGTAEVFVSQTPAVVESKPGLLARLTQLISGTPDEIAVEEPAEKPAATLSAGDLFGEMTWMSLYQQSVTVRASTDCEMLEMLRNVADIIRRNKSLKSQLDATYSQLALDDHLRSVPMFSKLPQEYIDELRSQADLKQYEKGEIVYRQNDRAEYFYLVRLGFVKVTEQHRAAELVLSYHGRGGSFGEIDLLGSGCRTSTVTALDKVELVRIPATVFREMVDRFPEVKRELENVAREREREHTRRAMSGTSGALEEFLKQGLMEAQSLLVLDLTKCTRCDDCVRACADAHDGVSRLVREGLRYDNYLIATSCRQCADPQCMAGCPVGAIRRKNSRDIVIEDWCVGCGLCARNCQYGNISMQPVKVKEADPHAPERQIAAARHRATTCDQCTHQAVPACVYACAHDAAQRVTPQAFFNIM